MIDAITARNTALINSQTNSQKVIKIACQLINTAIENGKFTIDVDISSITNSVRDVKQHFESLGYKVILNFAVKTFTISW